MIFGGKLFHSLIVLGQKLRRCMLAALTLSGHKWRFLLTQPKVLFALFFTSKT